MIKGFDAHKVLETPGKDKYCDPTCVRYQERSSSWRVVARGQWREECGFGSIGVHFQTGLIEVLGGGCKQCHVLGVSELCI
jgi:hypothetical protein